MGTLCGGWLPPGIAACPRYHKRPLSRSKIGNGRRRRSGRQIGSQNSFSLKQRRVLVPGMVCEGISGVMGPQDTIESDAGDVERHDCPRWSGR